MTRSGGIGVRVQGMRRYYALLITELNTIKLVCYQDFETVLKEVPLNGVPSQSHYLTLSVDNDVLTGKVDDNCSLSVSDSTLHSGAVGLLCEEGCVKISSVSISPLQQEI